MDRIVKVGIIGCGGIANGKHMPSLHAIPNVEMVAFCDIIEERAVKAAKEYGTPDAKVYTDYKELLKDKEIEVVHVLTPNKSHANITVDALYADKHVMCEKPMAKTAADAKRMVDAAKATGKKLTIGYQHRQKPQSIFAKEYIENDELGEIYYANCLAIRRRGTPNWGVFLNEEEQGGGPIIDIATHSLDLTLYLMNNYEPSVVLGKTHKKMEHPEAGNIWGDNGVSTTPLEEAACAMIVMKNGATIMLETSWALNTAEPVAEGSCVLCGSRAGLQIKNDKLTLNKVELNRQQQTVVDTSAGGVNFYAGVQETPALVEARNWIKAIVDDTDPVVLPEQAYVVSQILEAIYTSSKTGKPVYFE
ncbi:MAG: Gfo/Idh/MocA family oxidoreductase [Oscillospiraceae bacterium]|nr:Gfo/Idh/MocA family oxidoreductase [Oscillospiraceae bacterium]